METLQIVLFYYKGRFFNVFDDLSPSGPIVHSVNPQTEG